MKLLVVLLAFVSVVAAGQTIGSSECGSSATQSDTSTAKVPNLKLEPTLKSARLKGNKLIVTGENFDDGATILMGIVLADEVRINARNDPDSPTTTLIAKKGGKLLPFDKYFALTVENANREDSFPLEYLRNESFWALALPDALYPFPIHLRVGDYLVVRFLGRATRWFTDPSILSRVFDLTLPSNVDWAFQAGRPGGTNFRAEIVTGPEVPPLVIYNNFIIVNGDPLL